MIHQIIYHVRVANVHVQLQSTYMQQTGLSLDTSLCTQQRVDLSKKPNKQLCKVNYLLHLKDFLLFCVITTQRKRKRESG
jgi:hypothetical protein